MKPVIEFFNKFLSFNRLIGAVAYICRVIKKNKPNTVHLNAKERASAVTTVVRVLQHVYYPNEIAAVQLQKPTSKHTALQSLSPFLHVENSVRVGGRLRNSSLPFDQKHPMVLPANCYLIELYALWLHNHYFHATKSFVIHFINLKFWCIGNLSNVVKKIIYRCTTCRRFRAESLQQIMGQLPANRVTESDAFSSIGIDFAGPLNCKCVGHRSNINFNIYVAIFVCLASRACHIEIVSSLTTTSFLDTLKRFVSRRGLPKTIFSDNGRTFVGVKNYLNLKSPDIQEYSSSEGISWRFEPHIKADCGRPR